MTNLSVSVLSLSVKNGITHWQKTSMFLKFANLMTAYQGSILVGQPGVELSDRFMKRGF